jgi:hypothetical protein
VLERPQTGGGPATMSVMSRRNLHRGRGLAALSELVPRAYPSAEPEEVRLVRTCAWWERNVPPRVARNTWPARFRRGVLVVHAASSAWAQELRLLLPQLAPSLERAVPGVAARRIRVRVGSLPPRPPPLETTVPPLDPLPIGELPEPVARAIAAIGDDRVREAVTRAAAQSLAAVAQARSEERSPGERGESPRRSPSFGDGCDVSERARR